MSHKTETITCQNCKKDFTIEPDDFGFYEKIKVPPPTFCFGCRLKRKLAFLNERTLFKDRCSKCGENIISMYSPESRYKVFCTNCYNDREDCIEYGADYNFSTTFFQQFFELFKKVPALHLAHKNSNGEGCEFANFAYHCRNAYLSYAVVRSEDIYYCKQVQKGNKICLDGQNIKDSERGYWFFDVSRTYNSRFLVRSARCIDSAFLFDCLECNSCFMSYNLRNKSYVFRNIQMTREEYLEKMKEIHFDSYKIQEELKKEFDNMVPKAICRPAMVRNIVNCSGDFLGHSKNTHYAFSTIDSEDSKYNVFSTASLNNSYDLLYVGKTEYGYETVNSGSGNSHVFFSVSSGTCLDIKYCIDCRNCKDLFGCIGLVNKQYCIFNKQYTKGEYQELILEIIKHMNLKPYIDKKGRVYKYGEFFPIELSPFSYNESLVYEEFPMTKNEVEKEGYIWHNIEEKNYKTTIESEKLLDSLNDVTDDILKETIACPNKGKIETKCTFGYRIMPDELRFYKLMTVPLPRYCPNCRYYERRKWKNPWNLWRRRCMKEGCENEFETSYAPDRPEIVYCEKCYQAEVY